MSLHTARVIPEKRFSCPPADVHFAGVEKEIEMFKRMHGIEIETNSGRVIIRQNDGPEQQEIMITAEQAETVCNWILEAAKVAVAQVGSR
jgi:hypothetical protein